jgi:hypothetical protein
MKLLPMSVSVNPALPATTLLGEMLESEGAGLLTVRVSGADVPPPGAAVKTVIAKLAPIATSEAGIAAVN